MERITEHVVLTMAYAPDDGFLPRSNSLEVILMSPRIEPCSATGNPPDIQALVDVAGTATGGAQNVFLTMARNPGLFRKFMAFSGKLFSAGRIPVREREIVIMRVGTLCRSDYELSQHIRIARSVGLTDAELDALIHGTSLPSWSDHERALIEATNEVVLRQSMTDGQWAALAQQYDDVLMIELLLLIGHYVTLAGFLNAIGVEVEVS